MQLRWLLLWLLLGSGGAAAHVYRCEVEGKLSFSDRPCAAGQAPLAISEPNTLQTSAGDRALAQQFDAETQQLRAAKVADAALARQSVEARTPASRPQKGSRKSSPRRTKGPKAPKASKTPGRPAAQKAAQAGQRLAIPLQQGSTR